MFPLVYGFKYSKKYVYSNNQTHALAGLRHEKKNDDSICKKERFCNDILIDNIDPPQILWSYSVFPLSNFFYAIYSTISIAQIGFMNSCDIWICKYKQM